jgi:hypothetical protein
MCCLMYIPFIRPNIYPRPSYKEADLSDVEVESDIKYVLDMYIAAITLIYTRPPSEHRREGALSPLDEIPPKSDDTADVALTSRTVTVTEVNHHKFSQWLKSNPEFSQPRKPGSLAESPEPSDSGGGSDAPSPPPKSFRNSLTMNLKRLSLSRTASLSSKSAQSRRWSGGNTHHSSRTPSPSIHRVSPPPPLVPKIKATNPAALFCHEVHSQRTTSERCLIYATKINELHLYDCGLSEWVVNMKSRGLLPFPLSIAFFDNGF